MKLKSLVVASILGVVALCGSAPALMAETLEVKGTGEVTYGGFGLGSKQEQAALVVARKDALARYVSGLSTARRAEYEKVRGEVERDLDNIVKLVRVLDEQKDSSSKRYSVTIRAAIDTSLIDDLMAKASAVQGAAPTEKSTLTFVFMARKAASVKEFADKVTQRTDTTRKEDSDERQLVAQDGVAVNSETTTSEAVTTGGSTEVKADQIQYAVRSAEDLNATISRIFSDAGFDVAEAEMVQDESGGKMSIEAFRADFSAGDDVSAATRKNAATGCRDLEIRYLAIGSLDVGQNQKDPASGLTKVFVNVNARVYDVSQRFPKTVASIGPVQYSGLGPTQTVAERNALQASGETAAAELVSQMRAKDLK